MTRQNVLLIKKRQDKLVILSIPLGVLFKLKISNSFEQKVLFLSKKMHEADSYELKQICQNIILWDHYSFNL